MEISTRPSFVFWAVACLIYMFTVVIAMAGLLAAMVFLNSDFSGSVARFGLTCAAIATLPAGTCIWWLARRCIWRVNFSSLSSPSLGYIEFSNVLALHIGYPQAVNPAAAFARRMVQGAFRSSSLDASVRILKLADGRMLPLDINSPAISRHEEVAAKLTELLIGKLRPNSELTNSEIAALRARPANRFIKMHDD